LKRSGAGRLRVSVSDVLDRVRRLIVSGKVRASRHGYQELEKDKLFYEDILLSIDTAVVVEQYPDYAKGPCVLVRQTVDIATPVHVLRGIAAGTEEPAVLVTAYRPDPAQWDEDYLRRKS
jgi:hypothetical protein